VSMNGWWHPVAVTVQINLWGISQAEELVEALKRFGAREEAEELEQHIRDQSGLKCGGLDFYMKPQVPALELGTTKLSDKPPTTHEDGDNRGTHGR
jgi:hypothetical protein